MIWIRKWYVQMYRGHRTYDEGILQPIRAHSLRHPLQEMQKTRFGDQIHKLWTVLRCVKMWNNVKHVWSKGYSRASRSPRSSGPFTQRHSRATSVALASVRSPLAWRCRRCHMDFHESKLDVARVLPHLLDLERCAKIAILCQRLEARENESKLESITQAQMFFAGPWDILRSNLSETRSNPPWRVQIFFCTEHACAERAWNRVWKGELQKDIDRDRQVNITTATSQVLHFA